jgi:hypothetical protein
MPAAKRYALIWTALSVLLWLIPVFAVGSRMGVVRFLPRHLTHQYACAALFTNIERSWTQAAYLVKVDGSSQWSEVDREVVSPMRIAGYRQRVDRIVTETRRVKDKDAMLDRLAAHVAASYARAFPDQKKVTEVKIIKTLWRTDEPVMTQPVGRWRLPPADALSGKRYSVLGTWKAEGDVWARVKNEPGKPTEMSGPSTIRRMLSNKIMQEAQRGTAPLPPLPPSPEPNVPFTRAPRLGDTPK